MGQLEDFRMFVAVVQSQGISRAADQLGIAKSAVSRRLALLEERFSARLIERGPGRWEVTDTGEQLYLRALEVVGDADEIEADFVQVAQSITGPLSVSLPHDFGRAFLTPTVLQFKSQNPGIQLNVDFDDRHSDLLIENYDLAIRITNEPDETLVARRLGRTRHAMFAAASYASQATMPTSLEDLVDHPLLHYGAARRAQWDFRLGKTRRRISFQPALSSNNGGFLLDATLAGSGIARLPDFIAQEHVASGALVQVLPDAAIDDWGIFLLRAPEKRMNARMRVFAEAVQSACANGFMVTS